MSRGRNRRPSGAEPRTEVSPFGNQAKRREGLQRIANYTTLEEALTALLAWRGQQVTRHLTDQDDLWIEARLEERVAVLRFQEKSYDDIRTTTLTGEVIADVQHHFLQASETSNPTDLENLASEFRRRYKPPIMPSSPFLQVETILSERLMKHRSLDWFELSLTELRSRRGATVLEPDYPEIKSLS